MLEVIKEAINQISEIEITDIITDIITDKLTPTEKQVISQIVNYLQYHETISNMQAQKITGKKGESLKKYLSKFTKLQILIPIGEKKGRKYKLNKEVINKSTSKASLYKNRSDIFS